MALVAPGYRGKPTETKFGPEHVILSFTCIYFHNLFPIFILALTSIVRAFNFP